jgi:hypothetical protein
VITVMNFLIQKILENVWVQTGTYTTGGFSRRTHLHGVGKLGSKEIIGIDSRQGNVWEECRHSLCFFCHCSRKVSKFVI